MKKSTQMSLACCVLSIAVGLPVSVAFADATPIETITVPARKREESILKVPVTETVLSGAQLERRGTKSFQTLVDNVPGLLIGDETATFGAQLSIRGVGTIVQQSSVDQSVALNIDGLALTQGLALKSGMFDVQQVEVLKGPQALFFGKGSPAGVVSLRTADPTDDLEIISRVGYESEASEALGELIVSGPLTDTLGARIALSYSADDGYFINGAKPSIFSGGVPGGLDPSRHQAPTKEFMGRATFKAEFTDRFNARLKLNFTNTNDQHDGGDFQLVSCPEGNVGFVLPITGGDDCKANKQFNVADMDPTFFPGIPHGGRRFSLTRQAYGSLEMNYNILDDLTLTSVTGYYNVRNHYLINGTMASAIPVLYSTGVFRKEDITEELRLTSDFKESPINFMIAGFYGDSTTTENRILGINTFLFGAFLPPIVGDGTNEVGDKTLSVFGQLIYAVTPEIELAAGGRYSHETHHLLQFGNIDLFTASPPFFGPGVVASAVPRISSDRFTPEFTATWRPTDDFTLFAAYKEGSKTGSFNTVTLSSKDQSFGDETVRGEEVGLKSRLFDRELLLDASAYNYRYSNLQVGSLFANGATIDLRTLNAASATVRGVDIDAIYNPQQVAGLTLVGSFNYNDGRFKKFDTAPCYGGQTIALGCNRLFDVSTGLFTAQDLSGRDLVRAPKLTVVAAADYDAPLADTGLTFGLGATVNYTGKYMTTVAYIPSAEQAGVTKFDARASLRGENNVWELSLIGINLGDKIIKGSCIEANTANGNFFGGVITGGTTEGPGGIDEVGCFTPRGRELWVRLTFRPLAK